MEPTRIPVDGDPIMWCFLRAHTPLRVLELCLRPCLLRCVLPVLLLQCLPNLAAQKTWVVDGTGNGDFKTPQAAVDAANNGDEIVIRAGVYKSFTVSKKALAIRGENRPQIFIVRLDGVPQGKRLTLKGIETNGVDIKSCPGAVHCEDVRMASAMWPFLSVTDCANVSVTDGSCVKLYGSSYTLTPPIQLKRSTVHLTRCSATGRSAEPYQFQVIPAQCALRAESSRVRISGGNYLGGNGKTISSVPHKSAAAMETVGSTDLWIDDAGLTTLLAGVPPTSAMTQAAIQATSTTGARIRIDPLTKVSSQGTSQWVSGLVPELTRSTGCLAQGAMPSGNVQTSRHGLAGNASLLLLGAPRLPLVTPFGEVWIQLTSLLAIDPVVLPTTGLRTLALPVPARGIPRGTVLTFQGLEFDGKQVLLSLPTTVIVN
ncbi:MAG: hypothetical protein DRI90_28415 [Deltaproteobacteria bacterium]|nr:MAG: hypothetical protein DRI90_28415 [Deltaproteobacteria bacterium]